jgi:hypothetical protein
VVTSFSTATEVVYAMASGRKFREESLTLVPPYPFQHIRRQEVALEGAASAYTEGLIATAPDGGTVRNFAAMGCLRYAQAPEAAVLPKSVAQRVNPYQVPNTRQANRAKRVTVRH